MVKYALARRMVTAFVHVTTRMHITFVDIATCSLGAWSVGAVPMTEVVEEVEVHQRVEDDLHHGFWYLVWLEIRM